jgi:hypothetical protein
VIAFDHRFGFETDGGVAPFFDGGVIEVSRHWTSRQELRSHNAAT